MKIPNSESRKLSIFRFTWREEWKYLSFYQLFSMKKMIDRGLSAQVPSRPGMELGLPGDQRPGKPFHPPGEEWGLWLGLGWPQHWLINDWRIWCSYKNTTLNCQWLSARTLFSTRTPKSESSLMERAFTCETTEFPRTCEARAHGDAQPTCAEQGTEARVQVLASFLMCKWQVVPHSLVFIDD